MLVALKKPSAVTRSMQTIGRCCLNLALASSKADNVALYVELTNVASCYSVPLTTVAAYFISRIQCLVSFSNLRTHAPKDDNGAEPRWQYVFGIQSVQTNVAPCRGDPTAFDRLIVCTDFRTQQTGSLPDGFCAPRIGWYRIEELEADAIEEEDSHLAFDNSLPDEIESDTQPTNSHPNRPTKPLSKSTNNAGSSPSKPNAAARKKALVQLGVAKTFDRNMEVPIESEASGSNFSDAMKSDSEDSDSTTYKVPKGTSRVARKVMSSPLAAKSSVNDSATLPVRQHGVFSGAHDPKVPKQQAGRPPKERKQDCLSARIQIESIIQQLADKWHVSYETIWKECDLPVGATPFRNPSLWNLWLKSEKGDRRPGEDSKFVSFFVSNLC
jgi:hypothetical protein